MLSAYKSVSKEKEALESSIKALSRNKASSRAPNQGSETPESGSERLGDSDRESDDGVSTPRVAQDPLNVGGANQVKLSE